MMTSFNEWREMREAIEQGRIDPSNSQQMGMLARLKKRGRSVGNYLARPFARMAGMDTTRDTTPLEYLGGEMRDMGRQATGAANYVARPLARMAGWDSSRDTTPLQHLTFRGK